MLYEDTALSLFQFTTCLKFPLSFGTSFYFNPLFGIRWESYLFRV